MNTYASKNVYMASKNFLWIVSWFESRNSLFLLLSMFHSPSTTQLRIWSGSAMAVSDPVGYLHFRLDLLVTLYISSALNPSVSTSMQQPTFQVVVPASFLRVTQIYLQCSSFSSAGRAWLASLKPFGYKA